MWSGMAKAILSPRSPSPMVAPQLKASGRATWLFAPTAAIALLSKRQDRGLACHAGLHLGRVPPRRAHRRQAQSHALERACTRYHGLARGPMGLQQPVVRQSDDLYRR